MIARKHETDKGFARYAPNGTGIQAMRALSTLAILLTLGGTALADDCARPAAPEVEMVLPPLQVLSEAVTNVASKAPWPKAMETSLGPGWSINGLTVVRPQVTTEIHTAERKSGGGTCMYVSKAVVNFSFTDPARIYVSSKYAPGSCEYDAIAAHENQHVGIHLNTRAAYSPVLKRKVMEALVSGGPVSARTSEEATARLQERISTAIDDGIREFQGMTARFNGLIDTTDNYLALQSGCDNW